VTDRRLHALLLPPAASAGRLLDALASALDGSGPAILPLSLAMVVIVAGVLQLAGIAPK